MVTLVKEGTPAAYIVVPAIPTPVEQHAAEQLQRFIEKMSKAKLFIADIPAKNRSNIYIGAAAPSEGLDLSESALGFDGYIVKTFGNDLILTGVKPYSCLYAVYHLLERYLGCGFFEDGDQIPHTGTVQIPVINDVERPRFRMRIHNVCMQDAQSGMMWWGWEQMKAWVDWLAKKRFNVWDTERLADLCGVLALAINKLGIPIAVTDWQRERIALLRRVFEYARLLGIRTLNNVGFYAPGSISLPGSYCYPDSKQLMEFVARYNANHDEPIKTKPTEWCGIHGAILDPRSKGTKQLIAAAVEAYRESLATDHLFLISNTPYEGSFGEDANEYVYSIYKETAEAVKAGDPEAEIWTRSPCIHHPTFPAQKRGILDVKLPVIGDWWLNDIGRYHDFLRCDYYWGLPWTTGVSGGCGPESLPIGNFPEVLRVVKKVASDPKADHCIGFLVSCEMNHRNLLLMDAYADMAWNPMEVEVDIHVRRWSERRYGAEAAEMVGGAAQAVCNTLLSYRNSGCDNNAMFRHPWRGGYVPGLVAPSVRRFLGYLPALNTALRILLSGHELLKESALYRFDLVDLGRAYLGDMFNYFFVKTRRAFRVHNRQEFERYAEKTEAVMHFMARYCSAHEQFRLKTLDEWAGKWPEIIPGIPNAFHNWITFTVRSYPQEAWSVLLDYNSEDHAELIEYYYAPRVKQYLDKMREMLIQGKDISGRLTYRDSNSELPNRTSEVGRPDGYLKWSPFAPPAEPELTAEDSALAYRLVEAGSVSGKLAAYEGPMDVLVRELLECYPVPDDLQSLLGEPVEEKSASPDQEHIAANLPDVMQGFTTPIPVEHVAVPEALNYLVDVKKISSEYNITRGSVERYHVNVSRYLKLTRQKSDHERVAMFSFDVEGKNYLLLFNEGSSSEPSTLTITTREA